MKPGFGRHQQLRQRLLGRARELDRIVALELEAGHLGAHLRLGPRPRLDHDQQAGDQPLQQRRRPSAPARASARPRLSASPAASISAATRSSTVAASAGDRRGACVLDAEAAARPIDLVDVGERVPHHRDVVGRPASRPAPVGRRRGRLGGAARSARRRGLGAPPPRTRRGSRIGRSGSGRPRRCDARSASAARRRRSGRCRWC